MALKAMLRTLDGLNDVQKALYKQDGDKFMLDVEPVDGIELVGGGLKSALLRERETREAAEKRLERFKDIDPDKAREAFDKVKSMDTWTPGEKTQELIEKRGKEVAALKDAEYAPKVKHAEAIRKAYESLTLEKALEDAAAKNKFIAPKLVPKLFRENVRLEEKDGAFTPVVVGQDGKPVKVVNKDGTDRYLTIEEFVSQKAQDKEYAPLVAGNGATGTQGGRMPQDPKETQPRTVHYSQAAAVEKLAQLL